MNTITLKRRLQRATTTHRELTRMFVRVSNINPHWVRPAMRRVMGWPAHRPVEVRS